MRCLNDLFNGAHCVGHSIDEELDLIGRYFSDSFFKQHLLFHKEEKRQGD